MATKKRSATSKAASKNASPGIIFTENAIVITLNDADKRKAQACLKKSGKITFSVREHSVTKLPQILDNGKLID